ncbi:MAG TPA: G-D-S-L family lipolytic protein [Flavobacterium sp.]|jgi:lysophospholipase L1-like esterase
MIKNFKWLLLVSLTFVACNDDEDNNNPVEEPITAGTADFSRYVALGNSLTSGYSDNALFAAGQENSYPNILSQQFALAGGGNFTIPYMNDNDGGLLLNGTPIAAKRLFLNGFLSASAPNIMNVPGLPTTDIMNVLTGPFNNMGVPGAKSYHLLAPGYGNVAGVLSGQANPYFVRFASSPTTSVLADAVAQDPTFFSLWIGNNDVLGYATSGGAGANQAGNLNPATYGSADITDPTVFASVYSALLDQLTANGAKGVVANLPYVTSIPFFRTVPYNPVPLDEATAGALNAQLLGPARQILTALGAGNRLVAVTASGNNPLLIKDESLDNLATPLMNNLIAAGVPPAQAGLMGNLYGQARHATAGDLILLTTRSIIGTSQSGIPAPFNTVGVTYPLQDSAVLTASEAAEVKTAIDAFNASIKQLADAKGLAFVDANATMQQLFSGGVRFGNHHLSASFITGGVFSLDGVHPGARGYAFIANKFLEAINAKYGSNFKGVDIGDYQIQYPQQLD